MRPYVYAIMVGSFGYICYRGFVQSVSSVQINRWCLGLRGWIMFDGGTGQWQASVSVVRRLLS